MSRKSLSKSERYTCPKGNFEDRSTVATVVLGAICVNPDRVRVVHVSVERRTVSQMGVTNRQINVQLLLLILMQGVLGNSLERLLDVDGLLRGRLKVRNVALGLAPGHRAFLGDLPLILLHIDLVAQHDEGEVLGVPGAGLDEELVPPTVQGLKRLCAVDVVNEDAAVRAAIERDTEGLESFLTGGIPQLQ